MGSLTEPNPDTTLLKFCAFTDGSKGRTGPAGAGVYVKENVYWESCEMVYRLRGVNSVFQAEVFAIYMAATKLYDLVVRNGISGERIWIFSDNKGAIQSLFQDNSSSWLVTQTKRILNELSVGNYVTIAWIKAHFGNVGNNIADKLARIGSGLDERGDHTILRDGVGIPKTYYKRKINEYINKMWFSSWEQGQDCRQARMIVKRIDSAFSEKIMLHSRAGVGRIVRFLTGHAHLKRHNAIVDRVGDTLCRLCNEVEETPIHILFQ